MHSHPPRFQQFGFGERVPLPFVAIHHAFERYAAEQPAQIAVQHLASSITFVQLDAAANRLAHRLRARGVLPGARVCLLVQRSIAMVVAILGILKAGGAYVPLDGGIVTDSSLEHVLADSRAVVTLAQREFVHRVAAQPHLCLEDVIAQDDDDATDATKPPDLSSARDGVYVIYTSGTTGKPKGVDVMHCNVVNLLCLAPGNIGMKPGLKVAQLLNVAFDMCAWEVLGSLANGCTLCLRGKSSKDWQSVLKLVDVVIATPSVLGMYDPADYPNIKFAATAGEVCPQALADSWSRSVQFFNSCGPTEITIVNTVQPHVTGASLSIGKPTPNNNVYILDDHLNPLPIGEQGIMWAGGAGITRGYLNLPDKTADRYRLDPFTNDGSMMFNTGDIGRWRQDGQLEHLGRADDQVKVKGFRVELDGVAAAMETCPGVTVATALLIGKELWGFYTPATTPAAAVKTAAAQIQPYYAVPTRLMPMFEFPHTSNGKTDKRALRALADSLNAVPQTAQPAPSAAAGLSKSAGTEAAPSSKPSSASSAPKAVASSSKVWSAMHTPTRHGFRSIAPSRGAGLSETQSVPSLRLDLPPAALSDQQLQLQDCKCERGVAPEQLHLVPIPIRVPHKRGLLAPRIEVVSLHSVGKGASGFPHNYHSNNTFSWSKSTRAETSMTMYRFNDLTRDATLALLVVGRDVLASTPGSVVSKCGQCCGWGHSTTSCPRAPIHTGISKEKVADVAYSLTQQCGVDIVCIVSDPKTSHAIVDEFGHRGIPVTVGTLAN